MARKRITAVKLLAGAPATGWQSAHIDRVVWVEDGKQFPKEEAREVVTRGVNSGDVFYVRAADGTDAPVRAQLRHGTHLLTAAPAPPLASAKAAAASSSEVAAPPDPLLALPVHGR